MRKSLLILGITFVSLSVFTSCGVDSHKKSAPDAAIDKIAEEPAATNPETQGSATVASQKTALELLQGKWQSTDDQTNFVVFENNHRKEANIVDGKGDWDDTEIVVSDHCMNAMNNDDATAKEKDRYISCLKEDLCWYILTLNDSTLSLSYMARGNTLEYKKVK